MRPRSIVVSNPSSNQEISRVASALEAAGALRCYYVPIALSSERADRLERALGPLGRAAAREARRRPRPEGLGAERIASTAAISDLGRVAAVRLRLPSAAQLAVAEAHRRRFDGRVARGLDQSVDTVLAVQGSALSTLRRARELGIRAILNATLPDPRFVAERIRLDAGAGETTADGDRLTGPMLRRRIDELAAADRILVPSSFARETYAVRGVDPERLRVVPLGVDLELFTPATAVRPDEAPFTVLFVGRISAAKGVPELVEGFGRAAIPGAELILVGDPGGTTLPSWARRPGIRHLSPVPRSELAAIFRHADAFVLPSLFESFGYVAIEAMASGLPVVLTENSIGRDAITDGRDGYLVPPADPEAIAGHLKALAADSGLRRRIGRAARERALALSWPAYCKRVLGELE